MEQLWAMHDLLTQFNYKSGKHGPCGCIRRGDGQYLRFCGEHNKRGGTHGRVGGIAPPEE